MCEGFDLEQSDWARDIERMASANILIRRMDEDVNFQCPFCHVNMRLDFSFEERAWYRCTVCDRLLSTDFLRGFWHGVQHVLSMLHQAGTAMEPANV